MALIRRNAKWLSAVTLLLLTTLGAWWLMSWHAPPALADEPYDLLDAVTAAQIERLRTEIGVDDDTLAALNLSDQQAETVLAAVRSWYQTNATNWLARCSALADQRALVRHYTSEIHLGQDVAEELATAKAQLAELTSEYESHVANVRQLVGEDLSTEQRALADRMRSQAAVPMPFRVLDLTGSQRNALAQAQTTYRKRLAFAEDAEQRVQVRAAYEQALSSILGPANLQQLETLRGYLGPASERVVAALERVLPVEDEG